MRHNALESIDTTFICPEIRSIDFTCNHISVIPIELFVFQSLTSVMLTHNAIHEIPQAIVDSKIQSLFISDNPISSLPTLPDSLKEISASNCDFTELPPPLFNLPNLETINFSCNRIEVVIEFPEVENINLSQNMIVSIPALPEFVFSIDISHNLLSEFNVENDLPCLQTLDLSHNQLTSMRLRALPSLRVLNLSHNPALAFRLELAMFQQIDTVDLFGTDVRHGQPVATIRELVTTDLRMVRSSNTTQLKYYRGTRCGYSETIGLRPSMEDSLIIRESDRPKTPSLYAVIDGHGGYRSSAIAASLIPSLFERLETKSIGEIPNLLKQVNEQLSKMRVSDGATVVLALVAPSLVGVAHLGDARALIVKRSGEVAPLTFDHKPTERSELDVLKNARAFVQSGRLSSHLAVSRAIGDFQVDGVFRTPDVITYEIQPEDFRLVLACDGVFDVIENEEVATMVAECEDFHKAAARVKNAAVVRGTLDNVSVIVVDIGLEADDDVGAP
jgi:serine/threonine protein phosphatase PrpC